MLAICYANLLCLAIFIVLSIYINVKRGDNVSDTLTLFSALSILGLVFTGALVILAMVG